MMLSHRNKNNISQEQVIAEVTKTLRNLIIVVEKENQSLRVGKVSEIKNIIDEKVAALQAFTNSQASIDSFVRSAGSFNQQSSSVVKLVKLFNDLDVINNENDVLIRTNLEVSNQLVEMYKENKTDEIIRQFGYNKNGRVAIAEKVENVMPSIGLNSKA